MKLGSRYVLTGLAAAAISVAPAARSQGQASFPDVPAGHWAAQSVQKLKEAGIVVGYPEGQSRPRSVADRYAGNKPVTRYELAVTLYRFVQYMERSDRQPRGRTRAAAPALPGPEAVRRLIAGGYLPKNTPLALDGGKRITADQLAEALSQVIVKVTERKTPVTPDSLRAPVQRPESL